MYERILNAMHLSALRRSEHRPKLELVQRWGKYYISNLGFSERNNAAISDKIASGMDRNKDHAVAKSISEYIERLAYFQLKENFHPLVKNYGTEGFAAYPKFIPNGFDLVKKQSYYESVEKYCWPHFWHNNIDFDVRKLNPKELLNDLSGLHLQEVLFIYPKISCELSFCISVGKIDNNGAVVGGACSLNLKTAEEHALSEMLRHYVAVHNLKNGFEADHLYYGNRLKFLAKNGYDLYREKLSSKGQEVINLPELEINSLLEHPFDHIYHVYRTRFKEQRGFISSNAEVGYL